MSTTGNGRGSLPLPLREHYLVEKELAVRLRTSPRDERRALYSTIYDELFRRVPHHPMLRRKSDPVTTRRLVLSQLRLLRRFLRPDTCFLEIGPGDCSLSFAVAQVVRQVYAVDVSAVISAAAGRPANVQLILSDGTSVPVPQGSVTVAFSNQLLEHLHPDDALEQVRNIYHALARGGVYIGITPNALSGPHDVSKFFDRVPTGFHLKEYTNAELYDLFVDAGFAKVRAMLSVKGHSLLMPVVVCRVAEWLIRRLPFPWSRHVAARLPARLILGIQMVAYKA